ncbi:unnamed protein product, partial [Rotaria sordida]
SHTGENLFMEYDRVATAFSIANKVVRFITDNSSNNLSAFGELIIPGFESYFITENDTEGSDDDDLHEINLNVSEGHCPNDDEEQKKGELLLSMKDLAVLREFISIFTLFVEATTRTQAEKCVPISLVAPSILGIYYDLENELKLCKYTSSLCNVLLKSLKERFGGLLLNLEIPVDDHLKHRSTFHLFSDDIFLISSFLDGQFRLRWILQSALSQDTKNRLCDKIKRMAAQAAFQIHDSAPNVQGAVGAEPETTSTAIDNSQFVGKDSFDNSVTPKRKSLFAYCETSQVLLKKRRINIMDEIRGGTLPLLY